MHGFKRIAKLLLCLLLFTALFIQVRTIYAKDNGTEISVHVPSNHNVAVNISGNGSIMVEGKIYNESQKVSFERLSVQTYVFNPVAGYEVGKVIYNGVDVTASVSNNVYIAAKLTSDSSIYVVFNKMLTGCSINADKGKNGWYVSDVTVIPPNGYKISAHKDGNWQDTLIVTKTSDVSVYLMSPSGNVGEKISLGKLKIDKSAPLVTEKSDGIKISNNNWKDFVKKISFGIFYKKSKDVTVHAVDSESGIDSYSYYISSKQLSKKKVRNITKWKKGRKFSITGKDATKRVIYVKITNKAGLSLYISSDGMIFDTVAPRMNVNNGETYYGDSMLVKVTDGDLYSVTLDGKKKKISKGVARITINASDEEYVIKAKDRAGNVTTRKFEFVETWNRDGITKTGDYKLKTSKSYKLGSGKWSVSGDGSNYNAGIKFYVPSSKKYNIIKSE